MSTLELEQRLNELASAPVEVTEERVAELEQQLLDALGARDEESSTAMGPVVPLRPHRRRGRSLLIGGVAAAILAVVVLAAGWATTGDDSVVIAAADDVAIEFEDGTRVIARAGQVVPDGARLIVDGSVEIDGIRYGPGVYVVEGGDVIVVSAADTPADTPAQAVDPAADDVERVRDAPPSSSPPTSDRPAAAPTEPAPVDRAPSTTVVPTTTPAEEPRPTRPPTTVDAALPANDVRPIGEAPPPSQPVRDRPPPQTSTTVERSREDRTEDRSTTTDGPRSASTDAEIPTTEEVDRDRRP